MTTSHPLFRQPWFFGLLILAILGGAGLLSRFLLTNPPRAERQPLQRSARLVEAQTLEQAAEQVEVSGYGLVEAAQSTTLASRVGGEVIEVSPDFTPGGRVHKGQWLLRLDPSDYALALREAEATRASARAALAQEQGQQAVARADAKMLGLKVSDAERQLMLRQPQLENAQAQLDAAEAALARAQLNLARTEILAPYDGQIRQRAVSLGDLLASNGAIGEMVASAPYWVTLRLPVDSLRWVDWPDESGRPGSQVTLSDAADPAGASWQGHVIKLLPGLETEGRRAGVLVQIDEPASGLRPLLLDTYVQGRIHGRVLNSAMRLDTTWVHEGHAWVIEQGQLRQRALTMAYRSSDHVLVTAGLADGERIVTSVPSGFVAGMKVRTAAPASGRAQ